MEEVTDANINDNETRHRYNEIDVKLQDATRKAKTDKFVMDLLGDDWGRLQAASILRLIANPEAVNIDDPVIALKNLKEMLDLELIEQTEFDMKKAEIINRI